MTDITQMPEHEVRRACEVLNASIRRLLSDPETKKQYEAWKRDSENYRDNPCKKLGGRCVGAHALARWMS